MIYYLEGIGVVYFLHSWAAFLLCRSRFSRRNTALICGGTAAAEVVIFILMTKCFPANRWEFAYVVFALTLFVFLTVCLVISVEPLPQTMFIVLSYAQLFLIVMFLSVVFSKCFFHGDSYATMWIRTILHFAVLCIYALCIRRKIEAVRQELTKGWWPMCALAALYTVYFSYVSMLAMTGSFGLQNVFQFLLLLSVMLVGYGVIFHMIRYMREAALNEQIERQQMVIAQKLELMQKAEEDARRLRHDFRHHMLNLAEYAGNGDNEAILRYLGEYGKEVDSTKIRRLCVDSRIDGILQAYDKRAKEKGIKAEYEISITEVLGISEVDLVAILGNLLENAIHGCLSSGKEEPYIMVRIFTKIGKLVIVVQNTCSDAFDFVYEESRPDMRGGVGISSIARSAKKYNGTVDFRSSQGMFVSRIVL